MVTLGELLYDSNNDLDIPEGVREKIWKKIYSIIIKTKHNEGEENDGE